MFINSKIERMKLVFMVRMISILLSVGLLLSACSVYGPSPRTAPPPVASHTPAAAAPLTAADIRKVRAYYAGIGPSNGRSRKGGLPPGIEKNLRRGKPLPPGIAKQYLPRSLLVQLPRPVDGHEYVVVAGKLLLVEAATQIVREVLIDALFD